MEKFIFKNRDESVAFDWDDILYIEADRNYTKFRLTSGKEQLLSIGLNKLFESMVDQLGGDSRKFEVVGKSLILRMDYIQAVYPVKQRVAVMSPLTKQIYELKVSKAVARPLQQRFEKKSLAPQQNLQLRELQTKAVYELVEGVNQFGRKATVNQAKRVIDNGDALISRLHFNVTMVYDEADNRFKIEIEDLNSANGTFVNQQRIAPHTKVAIEVGTQIRVGATTFVVEQSDFDVTQRI